jgi:hypothetical protein
MVASSEYRDDVIRSRGRLRGKGVDLGDLGIQELKLNTARTNEPDNH